MYLNLLGEKIYYSYENDSNKPLVVFIHGLGGLAETGEHFLKFQNRKYRLLSFDMIGRGNSSYNGKLSLEIWIETIKKFLREKNVNNFYILCHSLGGYLGCKLLKDTSFKIHRGLFVVPLNPFVEPDCQFRNRIRNLYPDAITKSTSESDLIKQYKKVDKDLAELFLIKNKEIYIKDRDVMVDLNNQAFYETEVKKAYQEVDNFDLIAGTHDSVISFNSIEKLANFKNKKMTILEGDHDVIITKSEVVNDMINDMVSSK